MKIVPPVAFTQERQGLVRCGNEPSPGMPRPEHTPEWWLHTNIKGLVAARGYGWVLVPIRLDDGVEMKITSSQPNHFWASHVMET